MRITDMLSGVNHQTSPAQTTPTKVQPQMAFDAFFAEADRRNSIPAPAESPSRNRERDRDNRAEGPRQERERPITNERSTRERERPASTDETQAVSPEAETVNQPVYVDYEQDQNEAVHDEMIQAVANILQITPEEVVDKLAELGIEVHELLQPGKAIKLLMQALGVENEAELLTEPNFPEIFEKIKELMAEAKPGLTEKAETLTAKVESPEVQAAQQATQQATVQSAQRNNVNLANVDLEGLDVTVEDGEVVVIQESAEELFADDGADENLNQQTAARSTTTQSAATTQTPQAVTDTATQAPEPEQAAPQADQANVQTMSVERQAQQAMVRQAAAPPPVNTANVIEQIMNQVRVVSTGGQFTEMRMTLRPENLGDIVLRVITQNGIVMAQFEAENQRVKEALESSFNLLRDALTEAGISFSELSVSVRQDHDERMNQYYEGRSRTRARMGSITDESAEEEETVQSFHDGDIDIRA